MSKLPYMQFYPRDWLSDPALRSCSIAAKGLWIELLCLMWESPERGVLRTISGHKMDPKRASKAVALRTNQFQKLITELHENGVLSYTEDGAICSRRMRRDEGLRLKRRECGKLGGNPNLVNQKDNQQVNQIPEVLHISDVIFQKSELNPPVSPFEDPDRTGPSQGLPELPPDEIAQQLYQIDQQVISWWNGLPGVKRTSRRALTPAQRRIVEGWVLEQFDWRGIAKHFPLKVTGRRTGTDGGWMPSLTWFLEEGKAEAVIDGKYDFDPHDKRAREPEPGQVFDPNKIQEVGSVSW